MQRKKIIALDTEIKRKTKKTLDRSRLDRAFLEPSLPETSRSYSWQAEITKRLSGHRFELDNGIKANTALSCVIAPEEGDKVLCFGSPDGLESSEKRDEQSQDREPIYILSILERKPVETAGSTQQQTVRLTVPGADSLQIVQSNIRCHARETIEIGSGKSIKLCSLKGNVELRGQNLIYSAVGSILESAKERISNAGFIQFCATFLTRIHSNQTLMTADTDIKIDAERVNLG